MATENNTAAPASTATQAPTPAQAPRPVMQVVDAGSFMQIMDTARFEHLQRIARVFANSELVPAHFQGNEPNCFVALQMALRLDVDPFMLMQKVYVVHGKPGIEGQLAIALINSRGPFKGPLRWTFSGKPKSDDWTCTCYAENRETGERVEMALSWETVKAEGWTTKKESKWLTIPELMFRYRTASWLGRLYCPEVLMGLPTEDELMDTVTRDVTPAAPGAEAPKGTRERVHSALDASAVLDVDPATGAVKPPKEAPAPEQPQPPQTPMPFAAVLKQIETVRNQDDAASALDTLNHPGYTDEQRKEGAAAFAARPK